MQRWLDIIKQGFPALTKDMVNKASLNFTILESIDEDTINVELMCENGLCFSWKDSDDSFVAAIIEDKPCDRYEIQDRLEEVFDNLFGESSSELYAARNTIIDDMYGLEVLGGNHADNSVYDIFYGLYLTDEKQSYIITGFGNSEPEVVFEKITGISRLFNRKPAPALISKGKSEDEEIKALRVLAEKLQPDFKIDYHILNCSFYVADGTIDNKQPASYLLLSSKGIEEMDFSDLYKKDKEFTKEIVSLLKTISSYDITGFTVTLFKDGRYGITYYPYDEEDMEEEHDHQHNDSCSHNHYYEDEDNDYFPEKGSEKEYALSYMNNLHSSVLEMVSKWDNGMILIQNTENFTMVYPYYNTGNSPFTEVNIIEDLSDDITEESIIEELGTQYGKYYPAMYDYFGERVDEEHLFSVLFYFKNNGSNKVDEKSLHYQEFSFDYFTSLEDGDESIIGTNLINIAQVFEELFIKAPYYYITFETVCNATSVVLKDKIKAVSIHGEEEIEESEKYISKVLDYIYIIYKEKNIFSHNDFCKITIFPNGKIGVY